MMDDSPPRPLCAPVQIYLFFVIFVYCDWLCYILFKIRLLFAALREIFLSLYATIFCITPSLLPHYIYIILFCYFAR
jgi:hypothetical protein